MTTFLFPGQGSQKKGMGSLLFPRFPHYLKQADDILGYSLVDLCLNDKNNQLQNTLYTQPALFVVNALHYLDTMEKNKIPHYLAGHSLGEYNALFAAEVFDFAAGLRIVKKRAELMSEVTGGAMLAVLGVKIETIKEILEKNGLSQVDIANYNADDQTVLSASMADIDSARLAFKEEKITTIILKVNGAFHSRYMNNLEEAFGKFLEPFSFQALKLPVIANWNGQPYKKNNVALCLKKQMASPVQWVNTINYLQEMGEHEFLEIGPGKVLTGLMNKINNPVKTKKRVIKNNLSPFYNGFCQKYNVTYPYVTGSMYKGIASSDLVIKMAKNKLLGFLGTGGMPLKDIEQSIDNIQSRVDHSNTYGVNLLCSLDNPKIEMDQVELFLSKGVQIIEASAFILITPALVLFRLKGIVDGENKVNNHRIIAKVSRPEVATLFLSPPPLDVVDALLEEGKITKKQAELSQYFPVASDLSIESDSGGHTDQGVTSVLLPTLVRLKNELQKKYQYSEKIYVGAAGGIGTPEAAAAAFTLGADFIVTGSINQCTVEAHTSEAVKDILQTINIQDTTYAPAGDMFEIGAKIQVARKGLLFPARANKLYDLYLHYNNIADIDEKTKNDIEKKYFKRSFDSVWSETKEYYLKNNPLLIQKAEANPKAKMALIFKWYFIYTSRLARHGDVPKVDYQIHCGPALGAFNQWVKGTELENWRHRHVDIIAHKIMDGAFNILQKKVFSDEIDDKKEATLNG
ncbi:MAG: ACP S-malonyltransferase [Gammaproteobacteria bacterium]